TLALSFVLALVATACGSRMSHRAVVDATRGGGGRAAAGAAGTVDESGNPIGESSATGTATGTEAGGGGTSGRAAAGGWAGAVHVRVGRELSGEQARARHRRRLRRAHLEREPDDLPAVPRLREHAVRHHRQRRPQRLQGQEVRRLLLPGGQRLW